MTGTPLPFVSPIDQPGGSTIGVADATSIFQAIHDTLIPAAGGVDILFPPNPSGDYWNLASRLQITKPNVRLVGNGRGATIKGGVDVACPTFTSTTSIDGASGPSNLSFFGDQAIMVASTAGAAVGGYIVISGPVTSGFGVWVHIAQILSIVGQTVAFDSGLPCYPSAPVGLSVQFTPMLTGFVAEGLRFIGDGTLLPVDVNGLTMSLVSKSIVRDISGYNLDGAVFECGSGCENLFENIDADLCGGIVLDPNDDAGIGAVSIGYQVQSTARTIRARRAKGVGVYLGPNSRANFSDITSVGASFNHPQTGLSGRNIKIVNGNLSRFTDLSGDCGASTNVAVCSSTMNCVFSGLVATQAGNNIGDGIGLWLDQEGNCGNFFTDYFLANNQLWDISIAPGSNSNRFGQGYSGAKAQDQGSGTKWGSNS